MNCQCSSVEAASEDDQKAARCRCQQFRRKHRNCQCSSGSGSHAENVTASLTSLSSVPKHRTEEGKEVSQVQAWSRAEWRWPIGLSEQRGAAALLCGCRLVVGLVKVLGTLTSHLELPRPLLTWAHAEVETPEGLEFFTCFIGFFMAWTLRKRDPRVVILAQRTLWVYSTERALIIYKLLK